LRASFVFVAGPAEFTGWILFEDELQSACRCRALRQMERNSRRGTPDF